MSCVASVLGVVRVTDVPMRTGARAYVVEPGLEVEVEGSNATAALHALVADYLAAGRAARSRTHGRLPYQLSRVALGGINDLDDRAVRARDGRRTPGMPVAVAEQVWVRGLRCRSTPQATATPV